MLMFCPKCGNKMNRVLHFEKNNNLKYYKCSNKDCSFETKRKSIKLYNIKT